MSKSKVKFSQEKFIQEMLEEVKNLKDLAKGELPEVSKEYIRAQKAQNIFGLSLGLSLLAACFASGFHAAYGDFERFSDARPGYVIVAILTGLIGLVVSACSISGFIDLCLQPRRMAIKAITSLIHKED